MIAVIVCDRPTFQFVRLWAHSTTLIFYVLCQFIDLFTLGWCIVS